MKRLFFLFSLLLSTNVLAAAGFNASGCVIGATTCLTTQASFIGLYCSNASYLSTITSVTTTGGVFGYGQAKKSTGAAMVDFNACSTATTTTCVAPQYWYPYTASCTTPPTCNAPQYLNTSVTPQVCANNPVCTLPSVLNPNTHACENPGQAAICLNQIGNVTGYFNSTVSNSTYCLNGCQVYASVLAGYASTWVGKGNYTGQVCSSNTATDSTAPQTCPASSYYVLLTNSCQVPVICTPPLTLDYASNTCVTTPVASTPPTSSCDITAGKVMNPTSGLCETQKVCISPQTLDTWTNTCITSSTPPTPPTACPSGSVSVLGAVVGSIQTSYCVPSSDTCLTYNNCTPQINGTGQGTPAVSGGGGTGAGTPGNGAGSKGQPSSGASAPIVNVTVDTQGVIDAVNGTGSNPVPSTAGVADTENGKIQSLINVVTSSNPSDETTLFGWLWSPDFSSDVTTCAPFTKSISGHTFSIDLCDGIGKINALIGWLFAVYACYSIWTLAMRKT